MPALAWGEGETAANREERATSPEKKILHAARMIPLILAGRLKSERESYRESLEAGGMHDQLATVWGGRAGLTSEGESGKKRNVAFGLSGLLVIEDVWKDRHGTGRHMQEHIQPRNRLLQRGRWRGEGEWDGIPYPRHTSRSKARASANGTKASAGRRATCLRTCLN